MEEHGVVPDVIDAVPPAEIEIVYYGNNRLSQGNELTPTQVKDEPVTIKWPGKNNTLYTLVMVDPDAPSRANPERGQIVHWVVGNVFLDDLTSGDVLASYWGSGPPKDSGLHRYIFLVYQQSGKIKYDPEEFNALEKRIKFSVRDFAKKYNLGEPIAGNFYEAQYDDYVPTVHAKIRGEK